MQNPGCSDDLIYLEQVEIQALPSMALTLVEK